MVIGDKAILKHQLTPVGEPQNSNPSPQSRLSINLCFSIRAEKDQKCAVIQKSEVQAGKKINQTLLQKMS
jgi:hypothetical protein